MTLTSTPPQSSKLAPLWTTLKIIGGMLVSLAVIAAALFAGLTFAASQSVNNQLQGSNARISDPQDLGENCTFRVERAGLRVGGTATLYHNESLWLLVRPQHKPLFYVTTPDPIPLNDNSQWSQDVLKIGAADDADAEFTLLVVAADYNAGSLLQIGNQSGKGVDQIPQGAHVIAHACVKRQ